MKALGIAATGMAAQQTNVNVIANNIANANTTGFKTSRASFRDLIYMDGRREGALAAEGGPVRPVGLSVGLGVEAAGTIRLNTQGGLIGTENSLDLAIDGKGYFVVNRADGAQSFTRDGSFQISPEGQIVTMQGEEIDPGLIVPDRTVNIEVNELGLVMAYVENNPIPQEIGRLTLVTFANEAGLRALGGNLLQATNASGEAQPANPGDPGVGIIRQGYLEGSNVNIIQEITNLISAQRAYEMNSKVIETSDQMMSRASQMR